MKRVGQAIAGLLALPLSKKVNTNEQLTTEKVKEIRDKHLHKGLVGCWVADENQNLIQIEPHQFLRNLPVGKPGQYLGYDLNWHDPEELKA